MSDGDSLPWFKFYPNDFMGSQKVRSMTGRQRGIYISLMCECWEEGSIPDDPGSLWMRCGVTPEEMQEAWPKVRKCFTPHPEKSGRLIQERIENERQSALERRERARKAGKASGRARADSSTDGSTEGSTGRSTDGSAHGSAMRASDASDTQRIKNNTENTDGSEADASESSGSREEQSRAGPAGRDQPNGAGPHPSEEPPPDGEGRAEFCGAVRTYAWRKDGPPDGWDMGRAVDIGRRLRVKWEASWDEVAARVRAVANMADAGKIDWLQPSEPFTVRVFNRDEERGVPLWRVAGQYLRRMEERSGEPDALDELLEEQGAP